MWGVVQDSSQVVELGDVAVLYFSLAVDCSDLSCDFAVDLGINCGFPQGPAKNFTAWLVLHRHLVDVSPGRAAIQTDLHLSCLGAVRTIPMGPSFDLYFTRSVNLYLLTINWLSYSRVYR